MTIAMAGGRLGEGEEGSGGKSGNRTTEQGGDNNGFEMDSVAAEDGGAGNMWQTNSGKMRSLVPKGTTSKVFGPQWQSINYSCLSNVLTSM
jgi:hypothetical protein